MRWPSAARSSAYTAGPSLIRQAPPELPVVNRLAEQSEEKQRIGRVTAELIYDGDTVFLGNGTTVLEVARNLLAHKHLTITAAAHGAEPDVGLAPCYADQPGRPAAARRAVDVGHLTEQALAELRADKVVIGVHAIDAKYGLTNQYLPETMTDRAILKIGRKVVVVADHSKFGQIATAFLAPISAVDLIVTDSGIDPEIEVALVSQGARVMKA